MRDLGFDAVVSLSLADPGLPGRLRLPEGDVRRAPIRVSNPLSLEHSELRTTLLGSLLDAARYNLARGAERVALFESGRAYLAQGSSQAGGVLGGEFAGQRRPPAFEPHCIAALAAGPLRRAELGRRPSGRPTSSRSRASWRRWRPSSARPSSSSRSSIPSCIPGVRHGCCWEASRPDGSARSIRSSAASGISRPRPDSRSISPSWSPGRPFGLEQYEDVTTYPAVHQDLAIVVDEDVPAARVREAVLAGGGELLRSANGLRPVSRRAGGRGAKEPRAAARVPCRRPHPHRRRGRRAARSDQGGADGDRGVAP